MKKLTLALVAALSISSAAFAQVPGANGQIKFTGTVTEKGCTIVAGNSAIVNLGAMPKAALKNSKSAWSESQLKFVDCNLELKDGAKEGAKRLESVQLTTNSGFNASFSSDLWANNGTAEGVGVEVEIASKIGMHKVTPAGITTPLVADIDPVNDSATYQVRGRMVGDKSVTAGSVESIISFVASYR